MSDRDTRVERVSYRAMGVDSKADQRRSGYLRSMLAFSAISVLAVYLLERIQGQLFLSNGTLACRGRLASLASPG